MIADIPYNPGMQITNTDQLPKGTGAKYLEVFDDGKMLIAVQWRRIKPISLPKKHFLIRFK